MIEPSGKFEITGHYELTGRGGFLIGRIVDGVIRIGMSVTTDLDPGELKIAGVEYLDNFSEGKYRNALIFAEKPSLEFVKRAFPVGIVIEVNDA